jgi:hypothetical protein
MTIQEKGQLIGCIITHLKIAAKRADKAFNEGDTWFALAFRTDAELRKIAKLAGV